MSLIEACFTSARQRREGVLAAYITAGYPEPELTLPLCEALIEGGADLLELGVPFTDPVADGPTLQTASQIALAKGVTPRKALQLAREVKASLEAPLALLTYYNPVFRIGVERFLGAAKEAGVDGLIIPDLPVDEAPSYLEVARSLGIDTIFLATPNTTSERLEAILKATRGFLYLVSIYGVTGARDRVAEYTLNSVRWVSKRAKGQVNVAVGFGVSRPTHIAALLKAGADGVIVGSAIARILQSGLPVRRVLGEVQEYVAELKAATRTSFTDVRGYQ